MRFALTFKRGPPPITVTAFLFFCPSVPPPSLPRMNETPYSFLFPPFLFLLF